MRTWGGWGLPDARDRRALLDEQLNDRRLALGLTWDEVATLSGVSAESLRHARYGAGKIRDLTAAGIERALGLEPRSIRRLLDGQAETLPLASGAPPQEALPEFIRIYWRDPFVRFVWDQTQISPGARVGMVTLYVADRAERDPPGDQAAG
jgi:transcriptional regulator with XRE-family HTH domain